VCPSAYGINNVTRASVLAAVAGDVLLTVDGVAHI